MPKTTPPADADQAPAEQPAAPPAPPERRFWRYSGPERLYAHIPVTVRDGDVVEYNAKLPAWDGSFAPGRGEQSNDLVVDYHFEPVPPAMDGCWEPCDGPATVRPDNHPRELVDEVTPDA